MGDYRKNPKTPFEVRVPNKIRKRIAMHEKHGSFLRRLEATTSLKRILSLSSTPTTPKRGSLWSRFAGGVAKMFQIKPTGVRE